MNKKLIRLTESDLHRIVKESVNQVLTELDWKTYANAAEKAKQRWYDAASDHANKNIKGMRKYGKQWDDFDKASANAFNRDYGTEFYKYTTDGLNNPHHSWDRYVVGVGPRAHDKVASLSDNSWNESYFDYDPVKDETNGSWFEHGDSHKNHSHSSEFPFYSEMEADDIFNAVGNQIDGPRKSKHLDAAKKGNQELKDYFQGNYDYQKGKGWQLKH